jgi:enoyl-CoA hydratase/carnithine racemase
MYTGRPMNAADALTQGLVSAVTPDAELDGYGEALAKDMLRAQPDALRLSKRSFDATLDSVSLDTALEIEERAQMLMIARRGKSPIA